MARPLRIEFPGAHYYVCARADRRDVLFRDDADCWRFIALLAEACTRYGIRCHAYCLLPSRYVLVLSTRESNLSRGIRHLNGTYSQACNRRHGLHGPLFAGRYQAVPFVPATHLLRACRDVLRLPVTAAHVSAPEHWRWSSYHATLGAPGDRAPAWLAVEALRQAVPEAGVPAQEALRRYLSFTDPAPWCAGLPPVTAMLEDAGFLPRGGDPREIPRRERVSSPPLTHVVAHIPDRRAAMRHAYATGHYSLKQIAAHFGVHYATVSRAVGRTRA